MGGWGASDCHYSCRVPEEGGEVLKRILGDEVVELSGVELRLDGGGVRAIDVNGDEIVGHQAFWFAWSQFMADTLLWEP